ncbi:MAG: hypothetical protein JW729_09720, partial [Bacteroidales bacterium]|nr:hypothetical protein [Bacteroidales bacterium]
MRKIAYILLFSLFFLRSNAQESDKLFQLSSFSFNSISVDSALNLIESKTNLHFTFNSNLIPVKRTVHAEFNDVPLCLILDSLLSNPTLNYQIIENQLVIFEQDLHSSPKIINTIPTESKALLFGGLIRDLESKEALPYTAISLQSSTLGTVSNEDG